MARSIASLIKTVKTIEECRQDHPLLHPIEDREVVGEDPIPSNIGALVDVHDEEETNEDPGEIKSNEFAEEGTKLHHIEGFTVVHEATENFRAVPQKVADGLDAEPGTHVGRTVFLVGELEIIEAESDHAHL